MGQYHNPAQEVKQIGRKLIAGGQPNLASLRREMHSGEVLVGLTNNGSWLTAPLLKNQAELDEFYGQYSEGWLLSLEYYAVPLEKLKV